MKACAAWVLLASLATPAIASEQEPDRIKMDGRTYALLTTPLEERFSSNLRDSRLLPDNQDRRPALHPEKGVLSSSGNWRGYVATWEILDGRLYLSSIDGWVFTGLQLGDALKQHLKPVEFDRSWKDSRNWRRATLRDLFPSRSANAPVFAVWYSGVLRIALGDRVLSTNMGFGSIYERELFLTIHKGQLIGQRVEDNRNKPLPDRMEQERHELEKMEQAR